MSYKRLPTKRNKTEFSATDILSELSNRVDGNYIKSHQIIGHNDSRSKTKRNAEIVRDRGFMYSSRGKDKEINELMKFSITYIIHEMSYLYMRRLPIISVQENYWSKSYQHKTDSFDEYNKVMSSLNTAIENISKATRAIMKKYIDENIVGFKVKSNNHIMYVILHRDGFSSNNDSHGVIIINVDTINMIVTSYVLAVGIKKDGEIKNVSLGPVFLGKKERTVIDAINANSAFCFGDTINGNLIFDLEKALMTFKSVNKEKIGNLPMPDYTSAEMCMFRKAMANIESHTTGLCNIIGWVNNTNPDLKTIEEFDKNIKISVDKCLDESIPLVDLSDKEKKFICNYIEKKGLLDEESGNQINLLEILKHPRYGSILNYPFKINGETWTVTTDFKYDEDLDILRLLMLYEVDESNTSFIFADFNDLKNFDGMHNLIGIRSDFLQQDPSKMISSMEELMQKVPPMFRTLEMIIGAIWDILSLHIVLYDRPERTRMIRSTETRKPNQAQSSRKQSERKNEKDKYVVTRILKPVKEAKEYIARMNASGSSDREYVLESWERSGHYRRLPHSEKTIWIEATSCHRRLPLSDKEIHIKL